MYEVKASGMHPDFYACWRAAGVHLQNQVQGKLSWLRADLASPSLEHLSFRLGNQLFFVRIHDVDGIVTGPGNVGGLLTIAAGCAGVPCIMPMKLLRNGEWQPAASGWGLIDARSQTSVDPISLVTDVKIEMTAWELQDFAVQVVRDVLRKQSKEITSTQSNPSVDPSLWFNDDDGLAYVIVRAARHPGPLPAMPSNVHDIAAGCAKLSTTGHFAPLVVANSDDPFHPAGADALPLWRGHGLSVKFDGFVCLGGG